MVNIGMAGLSVRSRALAEMNRHPFRMLALVFTIFGAALAASPSAGQAVDAPLSGDAAGNNPDNSAASQPATAQDEDEPSGAKPTEDERTMPKSLYMPLSLESPYASGDWLGFRTALEEAGIATQFFYNNTYQWVAKGGLNTGGHNGATIDWFITMDLDRLKLVPGGRMLGHFRRQWGEGVNPWTGSLWQVADDLDGDRDLHVDQLWYEQTILKNVLYLTVGFLDYQTIVDRNAFANAEDKQFMNQALDNNPLLPLNIGLGAALTFKPLEWLSVVTGVGDADSVLFKPGFSTAFHGPARFVWFTEPAVHTTFANPFGPGKLAGNYRFGMVYDPRVRDVFSPPGTDAEQLRRRGDDVGFYTSIDQKLTRENDRDEQGLGWFGRYGYRHGDINRIQNFWSTGLEYRGLIPSRDQDVLGAAVFQSIPSRTFNDKVNRFAEAETGFEFYYSIQLTKWLAITPDIQYISSPGIGSDVDDAIVLGVRTRISF